MVVGWFSLLAEMVDCAVCLSRLFCPVMVKLSSRHLLLKQRSHSCQLCEVTFFWGVHAVHYVPNVQCMGQYPFTVNVLKGLLLRDYYTSYCSCGFGFVSGLYVRWLPNRLGNYSAYVGACFDGGFPLQARGVCYNLSHGLLQSGPRLPPKTPVL